MNLQETGSKLLLLSSRAVMKRLSLRISHMVEITFVMFLELFRFSS